MASTDGLTAAAARRSGEAQRRVRAALVELRREGADINFAAVAARAGVSRPFLYQHPDLRAEIEALRASGQGVPRRLLAAPRSSDASLRSRLRAALDDNQRLRAEATALREELALAYGQLRELELDQRTGRR